jgi:hypothetical protein
MKKILLLTLITSSITINLYSQKDCNLEKSIDKFDSSLSMSTKDVKLFGVFPIIGNKGQWNLNMKFNYYSGSNITIFLTFEKQYDRANVGELTFKLKDGTVIKKTESLNTGDYNGALSGWVYTYTSFVLTNEELEKLTLSKVESFRATLLNFSDYPVIEENLKPGRADDILDYAACLLKEVKKDEENLAQKERNLNALPANCKPDAFSVDKITKQEQNEWHAYLNDPLIKNLQNEQLIQAVIFRLGSTNKLGLSMVGISKGQFKSAKGNEFYISFKDGTFLKFVTDEAYNYDSGNDVHTAWVLIVIKDQNLSALKDKLTSKPIDAVRVLLEDGVIVEQSINDKYGKKMMGRFSCFFNFLQEKGYIK